MRVIGAPRVNDHPLLHECGKRACGHCCRTPRTWTPSPPASPPSFPASPGRTGVDFEQETPWVVPFGTATVQCRHQIIAKKCGNTFLVRFFWWPGHAKITSCPGEKFSATDCSMPSPPCPWSDIEKEKRPSVHSCTPTVPKSDSKQSPRDTFLVRFFWWPGHAKITRSTDELFVCSLYACTLG